MKKEMESIILTKQELQIMRIVWALGSATVKQVCSILSEHKATAYTTVLTLMGILEKKGVLNHIRSGRAFLYRPLLSREQATRNQVRDLICRFFDDNPDRLIESVLENENISSERLDRLLRLIKRQEEHQMAL